MKRSQTVRAGIRVFTTMALVIMTALMVALVPCRAASAAETFTIVYLGEPKDNALF